MSQKIDGNLQVPQALRSVTTPAAKPDAPSASAGGCGGRCACH